MVKALFAFVPLVAAENIKFGPYPGYTGELAVSGEAVAYAIGDTALIGFGIKGIESDCAETPEGVANACGIHIHEGTTCDDAEAVGGHFYDKDSIDADPWASQVYQSKGDIAMGFFPTKIGTSDIGGRALVVHDSTGARVACGVIPQKLQVHHSAGIQFSTYPGYAGDLQVSGDASAVALGSTAFVNFRLKGVESTCSTTPEGVSNACGIHIHEGKTCDDADAVGGHFYDKDSIDADPWAPQVYQARGEYAWGSITTKIGTGDIKGRALVVHDSTGGRVACGLIPSALDLVTSSSAVSFGPYPGYTGDLKIKGEATAYAYGKEAWVQFGISGVEDACSVAPEGVSNACGIHIHEGKTCDDADAVGGHFYDKDSIDTDPWGVKVYSARAGFATGTFPTTIGTADIYGRALVVHDSTGARVACGLIPANFMLV